MKVLSRKRQYDIDSDQLTGRIGGRFPVHIDVGTGSGKFVLAHAKTDAEGYYIGMDPSPEGMFENSSKAAKQEKKQALSNVLFVVSSIEAPPKELAGIADTVSVILPWGSLRDGIVKADPVVMNNLRKLGKQGAILTMLVGYDERLEPNEMQKRRLPALSHDYFEKLTPAYLDTGIKLRSIKTVGNNELKLLDSDWAKKLAYGVPRRMYRLDCSYI